MKPVNLDKPRKTSTQKGWGLYDLDWGAKRGDPVTMDLLPPNTEWAQRQTVNLWQAYQTVKAALLAGDKLFNDGTTLGNWELLREIYKPVEADQT